MNKRTMEAEETYDENYECGSCGTMSVYRERIDKYYLSYRTGESYIVYTCRKCDGTCSRSVEEDREMDYGVIYVETY